MMISTKFMAVAAAGAVVFAAAPASAVVVTFATFSAPTTAHNFRFVNSGNSSARTRTTDAVIYTTS
ncbi:MAG: hypothetical protein JO290_12380, partial [Sphingomonadaceae bacterium]|nr:hypothetical protein [Sphingomonadaceae bacterium]